MSAGGISPAIALTFASTGWAPANTSRRCCCTWGTLQTAVPGGRQGRVAPARRGAGPADRFDPAGQRQGRLRPVLKEWFDEDGGAVRGFARGGDRRRCGDWQRKRRRNCACRRKWASGCKRGGAPRNASDSGATTKSKCKAANGRRTKPRCRCSPISAKGCCTWRSPNARCWPTKWAWAKPSRPSPRAPCCTAWARRAASWSSPRPRSKPNGRSKSSGSPRCPISSSSAGACAAAGQAYAGPRRSSPSSITSRCSPTPWKSTSGCSPTSWCWTRRSASRTGAPRRPRPSSACAAAMPSCSPAPPSKTVSTKSIP